MNPTTIRLVNVRAISYVSETPADHGLMINFIGERAFTLKVAQGKENERERIYADFVATIKDAQAAFIEIPEEIDPVCGWV